MTVLGFAQQQKNISIQVIDSASKKEIPYAHVSVAGEHSYTNAKGIVSFELILNKEVWLTITHVGYIRHKKLFIPNQSSVTIGLLPDNTTLNEVIISQSPRKTQQKSSINKLQVDASFLDKNRDNSLMQTLKNIPGVSTITIGSGQSKPTIRGLGFNRVAVVENGIKHEAQQWGADHGLEIDQYSIENIEVIKGASSLLYGSDAISGVINLKNNTFPEVNSFAGVLNLTNRSNNDLYGISLGIKQRYQHWFYKFRVTHEDFGDYEVPTDKITYDNYVFQLHNRQLRNTAGYNHNIAFSLGYTSDNVTSITSVSNVNSKTGFFANAHGLEVRTSKINYDQSSRDIDLPYHYVNHFKLVNNTSILLEQNTIDIEAGFQKNHREEHSEPVPHGYMPAPDATMERLFEKYTYTLNVKNQFHQFTNHKLTMGTNVEFQDNSISGWGFLIPAYTRFTAGAFVYDQVTLATNLYIDGGIRYDYGIINTHPYYEWFLSPVNQPNGTVTQEYLQRSEKSQLNFGSFSASLGVSYAKNNMAYKLNLGRSFRIPLANELASNGVNYHMYRYEEGAINLQPESSYQLDTDVTLSLKKGFIQITPFVNYFDNFIYLSPSSEYYETLQKYKYRQSKVLRYGGEITIQYAPFNKMQLTGSLEYVYAKQLTGSKKNFTLPFSPPLTGVFTMEYSFQPWLSFTNTKLFSSIRITEDQFRIVPPEKPTPGYTLTDLGLQTELTTFSEKHPLKIQGKVNNLFNAKAFDHTSFYRLIEVPEPGRNFSITLIQTF